MDLFSPLYRRAIFSPCGTWRYWLECRWSNGPVLGFTLLNPSIAGQVVDDPTWRRGVGYGKRWGFGGVVFTNLFALVSTDPAGLKTAVDPIGPENDMHLERLTEIASMIVCAWGPPGAQMGRNENVLSLFRKRNVTPMALKITKDGHPGHPLYLRNDAQPVTL